MPPVPWRIVLPALASASLGWKWWSARPVHHAPGILVREEPRQGGVRAGQQPWHVKDAVLTPLATCDITARALKVERYRWDAQSDLAPVDVGAGWGIMSDEALVGRCHFSNSGRYLTWQDGRQDGMRHP